MACVYGTESTSSASPTPRMMSTEMSTIAGQLAQVEATFNYAGVDDLFDRIKYLSGDSVIINGVSPREFSKILGRRESKRINIRLSLYLADARILIVTILTEPHEVMHRRLDRYIERQVENMGLDDALIPVGGARYKRENNAGDIITSGEGDSCIRVRGTPQKWPSLVIEAGYTQSAESLRIKARWWFATSQHEVKVVILVKMYKDAGRIVVEVWKEIPSTRPVTRAHPEGTNIPEPTCVHTTEITWANGITASHPNVLAPASYVVSNTPLRLQFQDILLRQPGPGEHDIVLNVGDFQRFASLVWEVQLV